jgi:hypothetical protein
VFPKRGEDLRDAPAAAKHYSLWANLSTPLLLPSMKVQNGSLDQIKAMSRNDYDSHILGTKSGSGEEVSLPGENGAAAEPAARDAAPVAAESKGLPVTLELTREEDEDDLRDALSGLSSQTGFKLDRRFVPSYVGAGKKKVSVRGWIPAERLGEVMSSENVARVQVERIRALSPGNEKDEGTEILVGIRIPPESSPTHALREAATRLAENAGFRLEKAVGYQQIPGTSKMVLIASGRVPIRNMAKVLGDPSVVKVVPAPTPAASKVIEKPKKNKIKITENPIVWVLLPMLGAMLLLQVLLRKSQR